jgi:citrate lyase subunit beta/citryl-CoA lyase
METALAMRHAYDIAVSSPRVNHLVLACGRGGDAARAVGYQWTPTGEETMYLRSKAVLDARAAGIAYPTVTSWWDIADLDGLRRDAELNRRVGFRGMIVMHPSHVAIVNEVFNPSQDEIAHAQGLLGAMAEAERDGSAATIFEGDLVDYAMVSTARELLELAERLGMPAPTDSGK